MEGTSAVSVAELAEIMHVPENEVRGLLANVRGEVLEAKPEVVRGKKLRDSRIAIIAAVIFLFMAITFISWGFSPGGFSAPWRVNRRHSTTSSDVSHGAPGLQVVLPNDEFFIDSNIKALSVGSNVDLDQVLTSELGKYVVDSAHVSEGNESRVVEQIKKGDLTALTIEQVPVTIISTPIGIEAETSLPAYHGNSDQVREAIISLRNKRIKEALQMISTKARLAADQSEWLSTN